MDYQRIYDADFRLPLFLGFVTIRNKPKSSTSRRSFFFSFEDNDTFVLNSAGTTYNKQRLFLVSLTE